MQNAWSALRGAVNEINAVLLSEDEEDEETERGGPRERDELELLVKQQQAQQEATARQLEQSEAETAKYAQQLANLRRECRHLRSQLTARQQQQQQQVNGCSDEKGIAATDASRGSSVSSPLEESHCVPLERLSQALHLSASQLANQLASGGTDPWDLHEAVCSNLERASNHAEFVLQEWEQTRGSASFQALLAHPLSRSLAADLFSWLRQSEASDGCSSSGASTPGKSLLGDAAPLIACVKLAARLVRCSRAVAVASSSQGLGGPWGNSLGIPSGHETRQSSLSNAASGAEEADCGSESHKLGLACACNNNGGESERKWRLEMTKRQQLQHKAAALQRRVLELTEDLRNSKMIIQEQREAEKERAKLAESEEAERLRGQLDVAHEQLGTVRELYASLLQQYERLHAGEMPQTAEELAGENRDLLLQLRSWQHSHAGVSRNLQEALAELAELRANAARAQALEKEMETIKREAGRLEEIREIQNISEVELIKVHAERDAMERELQEANAAVEKYSRVLKRVQTDYDSTVSRLRGALGAAQEEAEGMKSDLAMSQALRGNVQELEKRLEEAERKEREATKVADKYKEDNKALSEGMEKLLQQLHAQVEEQEYFVDKRIVAQMIAKHQQLEGQLKRRDEVFSLICDVLGFDEEDRQRLGLPRRQTEKGKGSGLSEQFVEFLHDEVS